MTRQLKTTLDAEPIDPALFRRAMRGLAGSVAIIATGSDMRRRGLTATSVCSLSDDPPSILVSMLKSAETHAAILHNRAFSMNVAAIEHAELASRFAGRHGARGAEKFDHGRWATGSTGSPILLDAVASLDCTVDRTFDGGTHTIVIGLIRDVLFDTSRQPLVYHAGSFGTVLRTVA